MAHMVAAENEPPIKKVLGEARTLVSKGRWVYGLSILFCWQPERTDLRMQLKMEVSNQATQCGWS